MRILLFPAAMLLILPVLTHAQEAVQLMVAGSPVSVILRQLGAMQEKGVTEEQLKGYARQFGFLDADRDGAHSKDEYIENGRYLTPQARRAIFAAADSDQDGVVTKAEYTLNRIITDEAKSIIQAMDDDKDGKVVKAEFISHAKTKLENEGRAGSVFAALDTDGNGSINVPEYLRVWGRWARAGGDTEEQRLAKTTKRLADDATRISELNAYWSEVSRTVNEGDFAGYKATCHPEGVLVSGSSKSSYPLSKALERWEQGFTDTKEGN